MRWRSVRLITCGRGGGGVRFDAGSGGASRGFPVGAVRRFRRRGRRLLSARLPFANEGDVRAAQGEARPRSGYSGGSQAYCVRTCDGRYFPISGANGQSRAASCNDFCPASETKVVYGSNIDHAATESGKPYSELPNAFRYRNELVAGCTCNGKDQIGLAPVKIENDPTLRKGDLVAGVDGLMVAGHVADKRGASLNFSPASGRVALARAGGGLRIIQR